MITTDRASVPEVAGQGDSGIWGRLGFGEATRKETAAGHVLQLLHMVQRPVVVVVVEQRREEPCRLPEDPSHSTAKQYILIDLKTNIGTKISDFTVIFCISWISSPF